MTIALKRIEERGIYLQNQQPVYQKTFVRAYPISVLLKIVYSVLFSLYKLLMLLNQNRLDTFLMLYFFENF